MNVMKAGKRYAAWTAGIVSLSMAFAMSGCASKYGPADAVTYVESVLDASYRAEFEEYMQLRILHRKKHRRCISRILKMS